jgi:hypothetical protein
MVYGHNMILLIKLLDDSLLESDHVKEFQDNA